MSVVPVSLIVFDLFDTLVSESGRVAAQLSEFSEEVGIEPHTFLSEWANHRTIRMSGETSFGTTIRRVCDSCGARASDEFFRDCDSRRRKLRREILVNVEGDILDMLQEISSQGILIRLLSNCASDEVEDWQASPLSRHFEKTVFSCDSGHLKPSRDAFSLVRSPDEHCLPTAYVADSTGGELEVAMNLGMHGFQATWFIERPKQASASCVSSPMALLDMLAAR